MMWLRLRTRRKKKKRMVGLQGEIRHLLETGKSWIILEFVRDNNVSHRQDESNATHDR